MAVPAGTIELGYQMIARTVLDEKVDHIQSDVAGLKADAKRIDAKVDAVGASLTEHRIETERSFARVRDEMAKQRDELKASIAGVRNDMTEAIGALRTEMRDSIAALRTEMRDSIAALRTEMKDSIAALRGDMKDSTAALRVEMKDSVAGLRRDRLEQIAWLVGTTITAASAAFAAAKFFSTP